MDIVVTIPKREYANDDKETECLQSNPNDLQFWCMKKIPKKLKGGDRIYFVKNGSVESSMRFLYEDNGTSHCDVTERDWNGHNLYMDDLRYEDGTIKTKGFQGFRYRWW
jgi:hypothetical protein